MPLTWCLPLLTLLADPHWVVTAPGDGQTDATAAIQTLLDQAGKAGGGVVEVPAGRYRLNGTLSIPANVTLQGIFRVPPTSGPVEIAKLPGTVLFAYAGRGAPDGPPFIRLAGSNSAVAGLIVAYPEWKQSDVPPVPYPPCIESHDTENVGVHECCLLNPYEGIKLIRSHRHLVRNITGYPIKRGIYVDECYDIGHVENIHFWPFGVSYRADDPYCYWINTQGVAFELARTDWHYVANTFCFGYGIGYHFAESEHGSTNGNFLGLGADSCQRAVVVDQAQPPGLLITNGEFVGRWSSTDAVCVEVGPKCEGKVSLVNCSFWGPIDRCVWMRSPAGWFSADACHFVQWDLRGRGAAALQLDAGRCLVTGCTFAQENLDVQVGAKVDSAILSANQAEGGFRVENAAGAKCQMALNSPDAMAWTDEARRHYHVTVGERGDGRYILEANGQERTDRPMRWTGASTKLMLPVAAGAEYTLELAVLVPQEAAADDAGLYLGDRRLATLPAGEGTITATVPAGAGDRVRLELRCTGWVPQKLHPGSNDPRTLGVQLFGLTMRAAGAATRVFDANHGEWLP
jgi:hypothetical protein